MQVYDFFQSATEIISTLIENIFQYTHAIMIRAELNILLRTHQHS